MVLRRLACAAAWTAVLVTAAGAHAAAPSTVRTPEPFETQVAAAKTAMMADPQAALVRSTAALQTAQAQSGPNRRQRIATAQWLQGEALLRLNRLEEARPVIAEGLAAAIKAAPDTKLHGDLVMAHAGVLATQGAVQEALADLQAAYRIFGKAGEARSQAMALMNIGSIYQDARDYTKVLQYYAQAAETYPGDQALLITASNNIGNAYKALKKYAEAEAEFEKARQIAREMKSPLLEAHILTALAAAEVEHGRLDEAQGHIDAALRIAQSEPSAQDWLPGVWGVAAQVEMKRGRPQAAANLLERTFKGVDLTTTTLMERDFHETAYLAYSALGDDRRALVHLRAFKRLDDEARDLAANTNAALMAAQFDYANQSSRIATLKAGQLQRDIVLSKQRNLITGGLLAASLIIAGLLSAAVFWIRHSRDAVRAANGKLSIANTSLEKALNVRTEFLATTSHEIRTPLNGILGMTEVIMAEPGLDPAIREKLSVVSTAGQSMKALIDDILDLSKIETGKMLINRAPMDLHQLCEEVMRLWGDKAQAKGLVLTLDDGGAPSRIVEDVNRLRQILFNLMSNAVKFTHEGAVTLTARTAVRDGGEMLVLSVSDNGIGIPKDRLEDVFESFRQVDSSITRTYGGTGLGLAICRNLARGMGGDITVESRLGKGTTFTVRLPLRRPEIAVESGAAATLDGPEALQQCRLLLADANPLSQSVLRTVLTPKVRAVETVGSCGEAATAAGSRRFDLLLIDAAVLGGSPAERAIALRSLIGAVAPADVTVMIGGAAESEAAQLLAAGAVQVVHKPIAAAALVQALEDGLSGRCDKAAGTRRSISVA